MDPVLPAPTRTLDKVSLEISGNFDVFKKDFKNTTVLDSLAVFLVNEFRFSSLHCTILVLLYALFIQRRLFPVGSF